VTVRHAKVFDFTGLGTENSTVKTTMLFLVFNVPAAATDRLDTRRINDVTE